MTSQGTRKQSDAVYRRRRTVVGTLAVLALVGLLWLISSAIGWFSGDGDDPQEPASEQQTEEPGEGQDPAAGAEPEESPDPSAEGDDGGSDGNCAPGDIEVTALTGDEAYGPMEAPLLIMEIEHTGSEECTLDVGTAQQTFVISSEGREIFNTAQCGSDDDSSLEMDFEPGQTERAQLTWPRSESAADCAEPAELEPGAYELTVELGGISSEAHEFTLTEA